LLSTIEQTTGLYEFLFADTLHCGMENWTLKQMVDCMDKQAHDDIDQLFTVKEAIVKKMNETIATYDKLMAKLPVQFISNQPEGEKTKC
jgi:hypothetical protein